MMTIEEMIVVLEAFREGKRIRGRRKGLEEIWHPMAAPTWNFDMAEYQVEPEMNIEIHGKLKTADSDMHFTEMPTSSQDKMAGDLISSVIGDLYIDHHKQHPMYQWTQVAKALRVHGFRVSLEDE